MQKIKVILIGPRKSGKTTVANFLADASESSGDYHPTEGVRILQFETSNLGANNQSVRAEIELWDCSGDRRRFETCWPAFQQDTMGVVFVYDPNVNEHISELETLHSYFVQQGGLGNNNCLLLSNPRSPQRSSTSNLGGVLSHIHQTTVSIDDNSLKLRSDFNIFIANLITRMRDTHEQEELSIMGSSTPL